MGELTFLPANPCSTQRWGLPLDSTLANTPGDRRAGGSLRLWCLSVQRFISFDAAIEPLSACALARSFLLVR